MTKKNLVWVGDHQDGGIDHVRATAACLLPFRRLVFLMDKEWSEATVLLERSARKPCRVPFGVFFSVLTASAAVLGAITVGTLLFTAVAGGNAVFARDIHNITIQNVVQLVHLVVSTPTNNLLSLGLHALLDSRADAAYLTPASLALQRDLFGHTLAYVDGIFAGFPNGAIMGYGTRTEFINSTRANTNSTFSVNVHSYNAFGLPNGNATSTMHNFDARRTSWYYVASIAPRTASVAWTDVEVLPFCKCVGMSVARAIYVNPTTIGAVVGTSLRLDILSAALNATKIGRTGELFILDKVGNLIGLSDPARLNFIFSTLKHVTAINDNLLRDSVNFVLSFSGNQSFSHIPDLPSEVASLNGREYLLSTFSLAGVLDWTVIVLIPRDDYFASSDAGVRNALIVGLCAVVVLVAVAVITSVVLLTLPLRRLARGMDTVADTFSAPTVRRGSFINEVDAMEKAYGNMAAGIHNFSKYVPGPVVRQLLQGTQDPKVGVSSRVCTFFFSDIVGFTSVSERLSEADLSILLCEYFGAMENILQDLHGITTDFLGDGIFVFWNAPTFNDNHALLACEAALRQRVALRDLNTQWRERGFPPLDIRIGINTGPCLVGNFGSNNHMKYTVMGDAVNVASRLEQVNKLFKTSVIIGSSTFAAVKEQFLCRVLDVVVLKGKTAPTMVYELLCRKEDATRDQVFLAEKCGDMLNLFLIQDFEGAANVGKTILERFPDDTPSFLLGQRCAEAKSSTNTWNPARELLEK